MSKPSSKHQINTIARRYEQAVMRSQYHDTQETS
jgi:hypothetical protein